MLFFFWFRFNPLLYPLLFALVGPGAGDSGSKSKGKGKDKGKKKKKKKKKRKPKKKLKPTRKLKRLQWPKMKDFEINGSYWCARE